MIGSGELWTYLAPSLVVLAIGLSLAAVVGVAHRPAAGAVLGARRRARRLHHLPLFDPERRAGAADRAVGRLRHQRQDHHPVPVRLLPDGRSTPIRASRTSITSSSRSAARSAAPSGNCGPTSCCPARLPFIVTGLRLAVGRGLIGMVLADLYTAISGIGYLIVRTASTYRGRQDVRADRDARAAGCYAHGTACVSSKLASRRGRRRAIRIDRSKPARRGRDNDQDNRGNDKGGIHHAKKHWLGRGIGLLVLAGCVLAADAGLQRRVGGTARPCARSISACRWRRRTSCTPRLMSPRNLAFSRSAASTPPSSSSKAAARRRRKRRPRRAPRWSR